MESILERDINKEVKSSYLDYAMSVIVSRAIPDVKDGLKPVQRRILYAMHEASLIHNKPHKKSARVVGDVLGKYHPHGDSSVYEALVRMSQEFSMRYPLVDGHGNFGSIDGDSPAAMRYTEVRLKDIAEEMLENLKKETVEFIPNFDESLKEPSYLPSKIPNLLINGVSGIAVGMATNMPPHNLSEVADGIIAYIDNPGISIEKLTTFIKAPDFPTGGIVYKKDLLSAYKTGRGTISVRGRVKVEEDGRRIVISEIPYQVNKSSLVEKIASLAREDKIKGIKDIRDESDREGLRITIELAKNANEEYVLSQLYKNTPLETTFGVNNMVLVDGRPELLNLKSLISEFVKHRKAIIVRRSEYDLKNAEDRSHILDGLLIALGDIDNVIRIIRGSNDVKEAKFSLSSKYNLSNEQIGAILEMKLQKLVSLEKKKIEDEHDDLKRDIKNLSEILSSEKRQYDIIKEEMEGIKEDYGDERRTEIKEGFEMIVEEDLIPDIDYLVTLTDEDYIKMTPLEIYRIQGRGGRGVAGVKGDVRLKLLSVVNGREKILFFTDKGKVYGIDAYRIPEAGRVSKGRSIVNLLKLDKDEKITSLMSISYKDEDENLVMVTKGGIVKKTATREFEKIISSGKIAIKLREDDDLVSVKKCNEGDSIFLVTKNGMATRFKEKEVRRTGRNTYGMIGMRFKDDEVVAMETIGPDEEEILVVTEGGYGKRVSVKNFSLKHRGTHGVKAISRKERVKDVVNVKRGDEIIVGSREGHIIGTDALEISKQGRNAKGVLLIKLEKGDFAVDLARIRKTLLST